MDTTEKYRGLVTDLKYSLNKGAVVTGSFINLKYLHLHSMFSIQFYYHM